ncbi:MAG: hypothetical protein JRI51_12795 [Deltaproteobacteria bacterium]|nr:hypothetical protein [Deltaproteobacteria bacterium]
MKTLNRDAFIIKPKEPYIRWAASREEGNLSLAEGLRNRAAVYLVPEGPTGREETPPLDDYSKEIFQYELEAWDTDESKWPAPRTLEMFLLGK